MMSKPIGCMTHLVLSERKNMFNNLIESTSVCEDILYNCLSDIV